MGAALGYELQGHRRPAPANHTGWAPLVAKPYLVLKCKFADVDTEPKEEEFYSNVFLARGGLSDYWRDMSYGSWHMRGTVVVPGWSRMAVTNAEWRALPSRASRAGRCRETYTGPTTGLLHSVVFVNAGGDAGSVGGRILVGPSAHPAFIAHELGHSLGWIHSYDDSQRKSSSWSKPGEYWDHWDIMSAMNVRTFNHWFGKAGPGLNAPFRTRKLFIPAHRILHAGVTGSPELQLAALTRPEADGPLMIRIGGDDADYVTIEYRLSEGWDQGFSAASVMVHRVVNGRPYLITVDGGAERTVGERLVYDLGVLRIDLTVLSFATRGYTARVLIHLSPAPAPAPPPGDDDGDAGIGDSEDHGGEGDDP